MNKILLSLSFYFITDSLPAQIIRDGKVLERVSSGVITEQPVVLYEHPGFQGRSKSFGVGNYRLISEADLNDMASSIKVPPGMVAMIYDQYNEKGGGGMFTDLLEDCADLSQYKFNDKISYLSVFKNTNAQGMVWVRTRLVNNEIVAGHWERKRADGKLPDNTPPAVVSHTDPHNLAVVPLATQAEINEFDDIMNHQLRVAVLGGETTQPFYYHHNRPGEQVYKYNKVIDAGRLPGGFFDWLSGKLGDYGFIIKPAEVIVNWATDIKDFFFGSSSTKMQMDCWFPVSEYRTTVCGTLKKDAFICAQDYLHTQVTIDKDVCYELIPSEKYKHILTNRWTKETSDHIEGEIKPVMLTNYNTATGKLTETTTPRNPALLQIKKNEKMCLYGPWMGDILDLNLKIPIPLTDEKVELGNIDLRKNNEIHPVNQLWKKTAENEWILIAMADGTGYFQKTGNGEVEASGLNQKMRFYFAFYLPASKITRITSMQEYHINGIGFEFTEKPITNVTEETLTLNEHDVVRLKIYNNSFIRNVKTHSVFFDKIRKRADGSVQGYIVIETEKITKQGGTINIFVKGNNLVVSDLPIKHTLQPIIRQ